MEAHYYKLLSDYSPKDLLRADFPVFSDLQNFSLWIILKPIPKKLTEYILCFQVCCLQKKRVWEKELEKCISSSDTSSISRDSREPPRESIRELREPPRETVRESREPPREPRDMLRDPRDTLRECRGELRESRESRERPPSGPSGPSAPSGPCGPLTSPGPQPTGTRGNLASQPGTESESLQDMSVRGLDLLRYAFISHDGSYRCTECEKVQILRSFKNKYSFQRHAFLYHEGIARKVFPCPVCAKEFSRPDKMK